MTECRAIARHSLIGFLISSLVRPSVDEITPADQFKKLLSVVTIRQALTIFSPEAHSPLPS